MAQPRSNSSGAGRRPRRTAEPDGPSPTVSQAQGMLMERHWLSAGAAMAMLRQCAEETSTTVQAVAAALVATRQPA